MTDKSLQEGRMILVTSKGAKQIYHENMALTILHREFRLHLKIVPRTHVEQYIEAKKTLSYVVT
jgi:hypothetical protein